MSDRGQFTNSGPILEAVRQGRTILVFRFSFMDPSFMDVHCVLPSLEEARVLWQLIADRPLWDWDLENACVLEYCLFAYEQDWLLSDAPAGLATSLAQTLVALGFPSDMESVNAAIGAVRAERHIFEQIKELATAGGVDPAGLEGRDVYSLLRQCLLVERKLVQAEVLPDTGFTVIPVKGQSQRKVPVGTIDTEAENQRLRKALSE